MNKVIITIVIIAIVILGIIWLVGQEPSENEILEEGIMEEETIVEEEVTMEEEVEQPTSPSVKEFNVDGTEFSFSVNEIRVNMGDTVRIAFRNAGSMPHDFVIDEFNAATAVLSPGNQATVEFVADSAGEYEYYCSVGNHRLQGMQGKLIVE